MFRETLGHERSSLFLVRNLESCGTTRLCKTPSRSHTNRNAAESGRFMRGLWDPASTPTFLQSRGCSDRQKHLDACQLKLCCVSTMRTVRHIIICFWRHAFCMVFRFKLSSIHFGVRVMLFDDEENWTCSDVT